MANKEHQQYWLRPCCLLLSYLDSQQGFHIGNDFHHDVLPEEASKKHERYVEIVNVDGYIFPIEILDLKISIYSIKSTTNVY
jgi:hypothetical protein